MLLFRCLGADHTVESGFQSYARFFCIAKVRQSGAKVSQFGVPDRLQDSGLVHAYCWG